MLWVLPKSFPFEGEVCRKAQRRWAQSICDGAPLGFPFVKLSSSFNIPPPFFRFLLANTHSKCYNNIK